MMVAVQLQLFIATFNQYCYYVKSMKEINYFQGPLLTMMVVPDNGNTFFTHICVLKNYKDTDIIYLSIWFIVTDIKQGCKENVTNKTKVCLDKIKVLVYTLG